MTAHAIIEVGEVKQMDTAAGTSEFQSVVASCSECPHTIYTGGRPRDDWSSVLDRHLAQHGPGRAVDIEPWYTIHADCSVCEDGGDIVDEDGETLRCRDCGTTWGIDGTGGERPEPGDPQPIAFDPPLTEAESDAYWDAIRPDEREA